MKDHQNKPDDLKKVKVIFMVDRETGVFQWWDQYYILDFINNIVFLIQDDFPIPICKGHFDQGIWYFEGKGKTGSHTDIFIAIFKALSRMQDARGE